MWTQGTYITRLLRYTHFGELAHYASLIRPRIWVRVRVRRWVKIFHDYFWVSTLSHVLKWVCLVSFEITHRACWNIRILWVSAGPSHYHCVIIPVRSRRVNPMLPIPTGATANHYRLLRYYSTSAGDRHTSGLPVPQCTITE